MKKSTIWFVWYLVIVAVLFFVMVGFMGYYLGVSETWTKHCESIGAIAVDTNGGFRCVQEVTP